MKSNIKKHRLLFLAILLIFSAVIGRFVLEEQLEHPIQLTVIMPKGSEQDASPFMDGVRDCAQDYDLQLDVQYVSAWSEQQWNQAMQEEKELGSDGILLLYPERFLSVHRNDKTIFRTYPIPVLCYSEEKYTCFPFYASFEQSSMQAGDMVANHGLTEEQIKQIQTGSLRGVWVPNWYQLGYRCAETFYLHEKNRSAMEDVQADMLLITKKELDAGTYDALLLGE